MEGRLGGLWVEKIIHELIIDETRWQIYGGFLYSVYFCICYVYNIYITYCICNFLTPLWGSKWQFRITIQIAELSKYKKTIISISNIVPAYWPLMCQTIGQICSKFVTFSHHTIFIEVREISDAYFSDKKTEAERY